MNDTQKANELIRIHEEILDVMKRFGYREINLSFDEIRNANRLCDALRSIEEVIIDFSKLD